MKRFLLYISFIFFCSILNAQSKNFWETTNHPTFDSLFFQMENNYLYNKVVISREINTVKKLYHIADSLQNPILLTRAMYFDTRNRIYLKDDSVSILIQKQISLIDSIHYHYDYERAKFLQGILYNDSGDFIEAYKIWQKQLPYFKRIKDNLYIANTLVRLGNIQAKINENSKALSLFEQANLYYQKANETNFIQKNLLNISNSLYKSGEKEKSIVFLKSLADKPEVIADTAFVINTMLSLYSYSSDINDKKEYAKKNYLLSKEFKNKYLFARATINYASFLREQKDYKQALIHLNETTKDIAGTDDIELYRFIYGNKSLIYADQKQWDSAYYYKNLYHVYNDSILGTDKIIEINKIEAREAIHRIEQEKKETELQRKIILSILFGVCCLSIAIFSVIYFRNKKTKIQKQLKEIEYKELGQRLKNELLQKENLQMEIDSKNRELASNTLLLTEKNRILENLANQIKELEFNGLLGSKQEKELQKQIKDHLHAADEWEYFKLHFENVHPDFFSILKQHSSSISENDLRLCAYIRIGMETKQIAQMLSVLPATINTSRYRIRQKLNIVGDISLEDFLRNL